MELKVLQDTASLHRWEGFLKEGGRVRILGILNQPDVLSVRIDLIDQEAARL